MDDINIPAEGSVIPPRDMGELGSDPQHPIRLLPEVAGYPCPSIEEENRKLIFENPEAGIRYFWVKPSDVAI